MLNNFRSLLVQSYRKCTLTLISYCISSTNRHKVLHFYTKTNQMHNISNLFYFGTTLYMFRTVPLSIIRSLRLYIQHQLYVIQVSCLLASIWHKPDVICTVLDSWWWTERPSETCRVLFQNKINLRCRASGWFYYRNILRRTVLQTGTKFYSNL